MSARRQRRRPAPRTRSRTGSSAPPEPRPWWNGPRPPWEQWPGVSLKLDAVWNPDVAGGRWESRDGLWYFDPQSPDDVATFGREYLRLTKGSAAAQPFVLLPWHDDLVVRPAFGWKSVETGLRRFRTVIVYVPKKNGKSALCSLLALYLLTADKEPGAEIYSAALNEDQARIVFDEAREMVNASPKLRARAGVRAYKSSIVRQSTASFYKVLCGKADALHGPNVHGLVVDELHTQRNRELLEVLKRGTSNRRQPLVVEISTAGDDRESIAYEEYEYAKAVLAGVIEDPRVLPVIFEATAADDWHSPEVWARVNPGLGVTKQSSYMVDACREATNEPRKRNDFLRLELDIWTEAHTVWIPPEIWAECRRQTEPEDLATLTGCVGVDLSETRDLTAVVAAFRRPRPDTVVRDAGEGEPSLAIDYQVDLLCWFFLPKEVLLERSKKDGIPYDVWARDGFLRVTDGRVVDYRAVRRVVLEEVLARFPNIPRVGFDPWNARDFTQVLMSDGAPMVEVRPIYANLSSACKLLEALVAEKRITHDGNPVLRWCFANAEVQGDNKGNIIPVKPGGDHRGRKRIDGVMGTVIALSQLMQVEDAGSVYDERGLRAF